MKTLDLNDLSYVNGGASKNDQALQTALTNIQTSIKDVAGNNNNNQNSFLLPMVMMLALGNKQQGPTVIAGGGAPVAAAPVGVGPVINISSRIRRW